MKLEELVTRCSVCQMFIVRDYAQCGKTIYRGQLGIDDLICQYEVRLVTTENGFMVVYVDVE